ncbi:MAG: hypothetical protein AAB407_02590 [Patescibacteria group bacterium]
MTEERFPPIPTGSLVRTTKPNIALREEWTEEGWQTREWNIEGRTIGYHTAHGLFYFVRHPNGTIGSYDGSELEVVTQK